jgi:hypothetical protein
VTPWDFFAFAKIDQVDEPFDLCECATPYPIFERVLIHVHCLSNGFQVDALIRKFCAKAGYGTGGLGCGGFQHGLILFIVV